MSFYAAKSFFQMLFLENNPAAMTFLPSWETAKPRLHSVHFPALRLWLNLSWTSAACDTTAVWSVTSLTVVHIHTYSHRQCSVCGFLSHLVALSLLSLCVTADSQSAQFQQGYRMHGASVGLRRQAEANLRSNSYHPMASIRPGLLVSLAPQMATGPASCLDLLLPSLPLWISVFSPDLHVLSLVLWIPACSAYHHSFQIPFVLSTNVLSAFSSISAPRTNQF